MDKKVWFFLTFLSIVCIIEWEKFLLFFIQNMKNKSLLLRFGLMMFVIFGFWLSFTSASNPGFSLFHLDLGNIRFEALSQSEITDSMMYVHFPDNWNDFWGFLYFSNWSWDSMDQPSNATLYPITTDGGSVIYECRSQVEWFYYNAERWERLWPLDEKTRGNFTKMPDMDWAIYTNCAMSWYDKKLRECKGEWIDYLTCAEGARSEFSADGYGYYWSLTHNYSWQKMNLTIWVNYYTGTRFVSIQPNSDLAPTFVRLGNKYPVGFIYDYNWWVGLAWCRFVSNLENDSMKKLVDEVETKGIGDIFKYDFGEDVIKYEGTAVTWINCSGISLADTLLNVVIEWIVWMSTVWKEWETILWVIGNVSDQKMQQFATKNVNNSTMMNYVRKKAALLCRGKWKSNNISSLWDNNDNIICWNGGDIDSYSAERLKEKWKTVILAEWKNITIKPEESWTDTYYDIYLLSGNLIIDETDADDQKVVFTKEWFVSTSNISQFVNDVHSAVDVWGEYAWNDAGVGLFIKWNFIINWSIKGKDGEQLKNKYFIYWKITSIDPLKSLEDTFVWRCSGWISTTDWYPCPSIDASGLTQKNPYKNAALVVIDQNYGSPLLR